MSIYVDLWGGRVYDLGPMPAFSQTTELRCFLDNRRGMRAVQVPGAKPTGRFRARMEHYEHCQITDGIIGTKTYMTAHCESLEDAQRAHEEECELHGCEVWLDAYIDGQGRVWREVTLNSSYGQAWRGHDMCDDSAEKVLF